MIILNGWSDTDPRITLAAFIGIAVFVFCMIKTRHKEKQREKQKQIAIEKGNVIHAKRISMKKYHDRDNNDTTYHGRYEYTVNGKTKHYAVHSKHGLPAIHLDLYYTKSPKKVFSDYDYVDKMGFGFAVLLGIAACILTMYLTGYFMNPII